MIGADLFATLALSASILAPALQPRSGWVGEWVFIKKTETTYGKLEANGTFTPLGKLRSIQYRADKEEKGYVQVNQEGKPVWVSKDDLVRLPDAVEHYTKMLDEDPNNDVWFAFRGWARYRNGKTAEALKDYAEAIRLHPKASSWYSNRGLIHLETKKIDDAILDFTSAIEINDANETETANELVYRNRAMAYSRKKDFAKAAEDYAKVIAINPESAIGQNGLAWLLSTVPDDKVRDGKRAVEAAKKACELTDYKNGGYLDTLAAAYAEAGDFEKAVEWQQKALKAGDIPIKDLEAAKKRLELFQMKKPFRGDE
jgi:tetratricopeptide (TPR) repeat protein